MGERRLLGHIRLNDYERLAVSIDGESFVVDVQQKPLVAALRKYADADGYVTVQDEGVHIPAHGLEQLMAFCTDAIAATKGGGE